MEASIINELFKRCGSKRSQEVIAGSPRFSWWNGVTHQFLVFPVFCGLCIAEHGGPLTEWLRSYGNEYYFHRMFHHAFFGYLVKDLTLPDHARAVGAPRRLPWACVGFYVRLPFRRIRFILCLRHVAGAGLRGLWSAVTVSQKSDLALLLFPWMTASNFISASFGVWYSLHYENVGMASRIIFPVVGIGLCAARQAVENARFRNWT